MVSAYIHRSSLPCAQPQWYLGPKINYLFTLPDEVLLMILQECGTTIDYDLAKQRNPIRCGNIIFSLCAGLTCKRLYNIHWGLFEKVNIYPNWTESGAGYTLPYVCPEWCNYEKLNGKPHLYTRTFIPQQLLEEWFISAGYRKVTRSLYVSRCSEARFVKC
ncbi:hypothetical protein HYALB_00007358 [Hymenoscyphus albidus]|uniref:Uncharacterized protein n=1 Tax=Hymenoscyphus albidus TaxID=595503 RepID=A0A9N9LF28_9HELO|nr:hypothetical protein HYALB_00007358 [Hymenoscyphus albidus]